MRWNPYRWRTAVVEGQIVAWSIGLLTFVCWLLWWAYRAVKGEDK